MEDNKYNVSDLIVSAIEQKPVDFESRINDIMTDKVSSAVNDYKIDMAQNMFNHNSEE